jgi:hypothetical protein
MLGMGFTTENHPGQARLTYRMLFAPYSLMCRALLIFSFRRRNHRERLMRSIEWCRRGNVVPVAKKLKAARYIYTGFDGMDFLPELGPVSTHSPWWDVRDGHALPEGVEMAAHLLLCQEDLSHIASSFRE